MTIGPYVISRGNLLPYDENLATKQHRAEADDGAVGVIDDWDVQTFRVKITVPRAEALNIRGYLRTGVRYAAIPFTLVDDFGTSWLVRLWDRNIKMRTKATNLVEMVMVFREEVL